MGDDAAWGQSQTEEFREDKTVIQLSETGLCHQDKISLSLREELKKNI